MEYSLEAIHRTDADMDSVLKSIGSLDVSVLMKKNKDVLVNFIQNLGEVVNKSQCVLRSASAKIDELKSDNLTNQKSLISLQQEVIQKKSEQLDSVKTTVQTEMKTWANVVTNSCSNVSTVTPKKLKAAVKSVVGEEDRTRNFVVYGTEEELEEEQWSNEKWLDEIFNQIDVKPDVVEAYRVGSVVAGKHRPLKVKLRRPDTVMEVLAGAKKMKGHKLLGSIFIAPDRSFEERAAHKVLVEEMKKRRGKEPGMYFYIKRGEVCCVDRAQKQ